MPFQKLKQKGSWIQVRDVDGDMHWLHTKLTTSNFKCAVVKAKQANLRTKPTTRAAKVPWGPAKKYYTYKILETKGDWLHVLDAANSKAWIHRKLVWVQ